MERLDEIEKTTDESGEIDEILGRLSKVEKQLKKDCIYCI